MTWLTNLKETYTTKEKSVFLLHGNTDDIYETENDIDVEFDDYLAQEIFSKRDIVLNFNIGTGLQFRDRSSKEHFQKLLTGYDALKGTTYMERLPSSSGEIFRLLDRFIKINQGKTSIALIIDHAELLLPIEELNQLSLGDKKVLVTLVEWATDKEILSNDISIVLIASNLAEINPQVVGNPDIAKIEVEFPDEIKRKKAVKKFIHAYNVKANLTQKAIAKLIRGLNRKSIKEMFLMFRDGSLEYSHLSQVKKKLIEKDSFQFIEFIESTKSFDDFAGSPKVVKRLKDDAILLKKGKIDAMPMGYLVCGPVGSGKSYLGECFAGEIGTPVVKLKNFRSKWVGSSEANWEKILKLLKNLAPVVVLVDEADAALGDR